ncbi:MAG TPA: ribonuclease P protein component [Acidimicrobiales bacterium]|nr:ribonuclease P protein component [Acidimicrobiales bacterium]
MVWRVSGRATFEALRREARRARSGPVSAAFTTVDDTSAVRVGYAVSRRVGSAVVRNRLRRRLRAVVREVEADIRPGAYLVSAGREACVLRHEELKEKVTRVMAHASRGESRR